MRRGKGQGQGRSVIWLTSDKIFGHPLGPRLPSGSGVHSDSDDDDTSLTCTLYIYHGSHITNYTTPPNHISQGVSSFLLRSSPALSSEHVNLCTSHTRSDNFEKPSTHIIIAAQRSWTLKRKPSKPSSPNHLPPRSHHDHRHNHLPLFPLPLPPSSPPPPRPHSLITQPLSGLTSPPLLLPLLASPRRLLQLHQPPPPPPVALLLLPVLMVRLLLPITTTMAITTTATTMTRTTQKEPRKGSKKKTKTTVTRTALYACPP